MNTHPDILVEVRFDVSLDSEEVPSTYRDSEYLQEVIQEAIQDSMYDIGAIEITNLRIDIEGLE